MNDLDYTAPEDTTLCLSCIRELIDSHFNEENDTRIPPRHFFVVVPEQECNCPYTHDPEGNLHRKEV